MLQNDQDMLCIMMIIMDGLENRQAIWIRQEQPNTHDIYFCDITTKDTISSRPAMIIATSDIAAPVAPLANTCTMLR
jgi:hypothetical protein